MRKRLCFNDWLCEVESFLNYTVKKQKVKCEIDCKCDTLWKIGTISQCLKPKRR